ncbi:MAG: cytochrome P450 [Solirubrobacterales bacterium]
MEAATATPHSIAPANGAHPPCVSLPRVLQTARFVVRPIGFFERYRRELGETFAARLLGPGDVVFVSDPDSVKRLFGADRINTIAPGRNIVLRPLLGPQSLLLQEGDEHLRRRKLMLPPFHGERMRAYESVIAEVTADEVARWPTGTVFALHPSMQAITLEVILRVVFGVADAERRAELRDGLVAILAESASPAAVGLTIPPLRRLPHYRDFDRLVDRTDELLAAEIAERRADPDLSERDDILSMLVAARFDDGSAMSESELRDQLMTLLLAGHETTATGLAWAFDLLLHHSWALDRLTAELESGQSEYLEAVVEESLRIRPVVPMTGRLLREPATLGGYRLDAGTVILVAIYMTHTNPQIHPEPFAFRPERFLDDDPETYSWVPFGGGTRRCIGAAFAEMEMRVVLRTVLGSARLTAADPRLEQPVRRNVTLSPRNGTRATAALAHV